MSYPQIIDYNEAVQAPQHAFTDPQLRLGTVRTSAMGLPLALSGGFALTYQVDAGSRRFAVRCFHREVPTIEGRYGAISSALQRLSAPYFVDFHFQPAGIQIRGGRYPIVKMDWIEGATLGGYLDRHASDRAAMSALRRRFAELAAYLESTGIAHGDLQNANIIVDQTKLRLIDYDGMFVPGMAQGNGMEAGHKHFQHPSRTATHFGPAMDRFSFIAIDLSLAVLEAAPNLHGKYREGGEAIVFKANDYADPASSEIFRILAEVPAVSRQAARFAAVCEADISQTPSLEDFRAGRNLPASPARSRDGRRAGAAYIGAYTTVDAADYENTLRQVGNRVELVGQVVSVKPGVVQHGRNKGKPYVFINFGDWRTRSVKLTIWSEVLSTLAAMPDKTWEGTWVSATGLIDQPYKGGSRGRPYTSVGTTILDQSQIVCLSEEQALFRLGMSKRESPRTARLDDGAHARDGHGHPDKGIRSNRDALSKPALVAPSPQLSPRPIAPPQPTVPARPQAAAATRNQKLLEQLNRSNMPSAAMPPRPASPSSSGLAPPRNTTSPPSSRPMLPSAPSRSATSSAPGPSFQPPTSTAFGVAAISIWRGLAGLFRR